MAIHDIYSQRQRRLKGEIPDVFQYDLLPHPLRNQIVQIIDELGNSLYNSESMLFIPVVTILLREYGLNSLCGGSSTWNHSEDLRYFIINQPSVDRVFDAVELTFNFLMKKIPSSLSEYAIYELNHRFRQHGVGYQFENGEIIRVDSEFIHSEAVKPALRLLGVAGFEGPLNEFLNAHEHYRHGRYKESISECLKSFESVMKAICDKRGWVYPLNVTSNGLIDLCFKNNLIDGYWQSHFSSLRSILESGIPTVRNKTSGHGQGSFPTTIPDYLVQFALHMTASTIVFLCEADRALP